MADGTTFHRVLWDDADAASTIGVTDLTTIRLKPDEEIKRVVLCSGKVYYDLLEAREQRGIDDVYLLRVEQYYPFPYKSLVNDLGRFPQAEIVWCQEEPKNMGAWFLVDPSLEWTLDKVDGKYRRPRYVGRPASASTATGLMSKHLAERAALLDEALTV
jgi:2-oxoglutarate dehydrogenase E1 component